MTAKTFPCSVSSLWRSALHHHPSPLGLRQAGNGDRHLEVGAGSALEILGPTTLRHDSDALPPLGLQTGATLSGNTLRGFEPRNGPGTHRAKIVLHQNMVQALQHKHMLAVERSSMDIGRERPMPFLPLRHDHHGSSSVVHRLSDLVNQIGRMYFRSDPVKYCQTTETSKFAKKQHTVVHGMLTSR